MFEILIHLIIFKGPDALTKQQAIDLVRDIRPRYVEELNVKPRISKVTVVFRDPTRRCRESIESSAMLCRYVLARNYLDRRDFTSLNNIKLVIAPPARYKGKIWTSGIANQASYQKEGKQAIALAPLMRYNSDGIDYNEVSRIVLEHELGHVIGAGHYTKAEAPQTVMHPAALAYVDETLPDYLRFAPFSVNQIKAFLKIF